MACRASAFPCGASAAPDAPQRTILIDCDRRSHELGQLRTQQRKPGDPFEAALEACLEGLGHLVTGLEEEGPQLNQELNAVARAVEQHDQPPAEVVLEPHARVA